MNASDIRFDDIISYLSRSGWHKSMTGSLAEVWQMPSDIETTVLVPKIHSAPDFQRTISMLARELSRTERRPAEEITRDIAQQFVDVTDLRAQDDDISEDTIPLVSGISLFNSAHRMMVSAAAATINRQGYYGNSMPRAAHRHARRLRLGQTRPGSYIVPVISSARFDRLVQDGEEEPSLIVGADDSYFERRMVTTLARALDTLHEMTVVRGREPSRDDMRSAVDEGVSSELCASIIDVIGKGGVEVFDVHFNWAPSSPAPENTVERIHFSYESADLIQHVGDELKEADEPAEKILYGVIRRMSLKKNETSGQVAMETALNGKSRIVTFDLDLADYRKAARYHGERRPVVVRGILDATPGRRATMKVSSFDADRSVASFDDLTVQ